MINDAGGVYTTNFHGPGGRGRAGEGRNNTNNQFRDEEDDEESNNNNNNRRVGGGDAQLVYGGNQNNNNNNNNDAQQQQQRQAVMEPAEIAHLFERFIVNFVAGGSEYVYLRALRENLNNQLHYLEIDFQHIRQYSEALARVIEEMPTRAIHAMEEGASRLAREKKMFLENERNDLDVQIQLFAGGGMVKSVPLRQLSTAGVSKLVSVSGIVVKASVARPRCTKARVQCTSCRHMLVLPGHRAYELPQQCQVNQGQNQAGAAAAGIQAGVLPARQGGQQKCRPNPYVLLPDQCEFDDQQGLKLQEPPEEVPTGELPRHVSIVLERYHVGKITPGMRIQVVGIVSVQEKRSGEKSKVGSAAPVAGLRSHFIRACGLMHCSTSRASTQTLTSINTTSFVASVAARGAGSWDVADEAAFKAFARGNPYDIVSRAIDPAIFGLHDPKRAIACLLFGGTRKKLDGNFLRGDVNVLLIGDPSTAKSQLLKFTEQIAPIGLYTSGKGSSAAGLTASVVGSGAGDFSLEAGSMVLADGGVVCIDEFDKMREQDQVAIHEAMEQQTISIAKANMTTMLNSRTSVLAAANPSLGSYDPSRSNEEQLDFQSSILSRFDLIFKVLDPKDPFIDTQLAKHVVRLHKSAAAADHHHHGGGVGAGDKQKGRKAGGGAGGGSSSLFSGGGGVGAGLDGQSSLNILAQASAAAAAAASQSQNQNNNNNNNNNSDLPALQFLTKYIAYARQTVFPNVSEQAATALLDFFVKVRSESHKTTQESLQASSGAHAATIQVTARQLESLIRVTESLARMKLQPIAGIAEAEEAIRLFTASTVDAIRSGVVEQTLTEAQSAVVIRIEEAIRNRVPMGATVQAARLMSELHRLEFDSKLVERALFAMTRREEIIWQKQRTLILRNR